MRGKSIKMLLGAVIVLTVLVVSGDAMAADTGIFSTIATKMRDTVMDLRKIVYILGGLGLIMFAVLAIFNKISFKHLMYLCFSLWLLSLMSPFIKYFSGRDIEDLKFGDNIASAQTGTNAAENQVPCTGDTCPKADESAGGSGGGSSTPTTKEECESKGGTWGTLGCTIITPGDGPTASVPTVDAEMQAKIQKCLKEGNKWDNQKNKCNKTFQNTLKDIAKAAQQGAQAVTAAVNTYKNAKRTFENVQKGAENIGKAFNNLGKGGDFGSMMGELGQLAGTVGTSASQIASGADATLGSLDQYRKKSGEFAETVTGDENNKYSQTMDDNSKLADIIKTGKQEIKDRRKDVTDVTNPAASIGRSGKSASGSVNSLFK